MAVFCGLVRIVQVLTYRAYARAHARTRRLIRDNPYDPYLAAETLDS